MAAFPPIKQLAAIIGILLWMTNWMLVLAFSSVTTLYTFLVLFLAAGTLVAFGAATPAFVSYIRTCPVKTRFLRAVLIIVLGLLAVNAMGHVLYCATWVLNQDAFLDLSPTDTPAYATWRLFLFSWNNTSRLGTGVGWLLPVSHMARTVTWIHDVFIVIVLIMAMGSLAGQMHGVGCVPPKPVPRVCTNTQQNH